MSATLDDIDAAILAALGPLAKSATPSGPFNVVTRWVGEIEPTSFAEEVAARCPALLLAFGGEVGTIDAAFLDGNVEAVGRSRWSVLVAVSDPRGVAPTMKGANNTPGLFALIDAVQRVLDTLFIPGLLRTTGLAYLGTRPFFFRRGELYVLALQYEAQRALPDARIVDTSHTLERIVNREHLAAADGAPDPIVESNIRPDGIAPLSGVLSEGASPVPGVVLTGDDLMPATTDAEGRWTLEIPAGVPLIVRATAAGYLDALARVVMPDGAVDLWTLIMTQPEILPVIASELGIPRDPATGLLLVNFVDEHGAPLAEGGFGYTMTPAGGTRATFVDHAIARDTTLPGSPLLFVWNRPAGPVAVTPVPPSHDWTCRALNGTTSTLVEAGRTTWLVFECTRTGPPPVLLAGTTLDAETHTPQAGVVVTVDSVPDYATTSGPDGRWTLVLPPNTAGVLRCVRTGYRTALVPFALADAPLDLPWCYLFHDSLIATLAAAIGVPENTGDGLGALLFTDPAGDPLSIGGFGTTGLPAANVGTMDGGLWTETATTLPFNPTLLYWNTTPGTYLDVRTVHPDGWAADIESGAHAAVIEARCVTLGRLLCRPAP